MQNVTDIEEAENLKIYISEDKKISLDQLVNCVTRRIKIHRECIKKHRNKIAKYSDVIDVVASENDKIKARQSKIHELREMTEQLFSWKI